MSVVRKERERENDKGEVEAEGESRRRNDPLLLHLEESLLTGDGQGASEGAKHLQNRIQRSSVPHADCEGSTGTRCTRREGGVVVKYMHVHREPTVRL